MPGNPPSYARLEASHDGAIQRLRELGGPGWRERNRLPWVLLSNLLACFDGGMDARPVHETDPRLLRRVRIDVSVEESKELTQRLRILQMVLCKSHVNVDHAHCEGASYHGCVIPNPIGRLATAAPTAIA